MPAVIRIFLGVTALVAVGCHAAAPPANEAAPVIVAAVAAPPAPGLCLAPGSEPEGLAADIDGDGAPDRIAKGSRDVTVYLHRGTCVTLLATIAPNGPVAFVSLIERNGAGVRDLSIDTWLFHGDRRRTRWSWNGRTYRESGVAEEIPGPRHP